MKALYILLFLLAGIKPAISDTTLIFKNFSEDGSRSNRYYLKGNTLRLLEEHSDLHNIYDKSKQTFNSLNSKTGKESRIDADILDQRVDALNKQRMIKLDEVEKRLKPKLKNMNAEERKAAESLLNQLKYPEFYGEHTFLEIHKTSQSKTVNQINCNVYKVMRKNIEIQKICIANNDALKLNANDYDTLRAFQQFNYNAQTRFMLAMGETNFIQIDYQQENIDGIPIEIINTSGDTDKLEMMLLNVSHQPLDKALFSAPKL